MIDKFFDKLMSLFQATPFYMKAKTIYTTFKHPFVKLIYLEELAYEMPSDKEPILIEIKELRQRLIKFFEENQDELP